jgi:hypothetical protein
MMGIGEWCPWSDSNRHASRHRILNPVLTLPARDGLTLKSR